MGKNVGLIGGVRGKVGNVVFSTRRGVQIARAYQPVVANPQTKRQTLSRAKLALATVTLKPFERFLRAGWQKYRPTYEFQRGIGLSIPEDANIITGDSPANLEVQLVSLGNVMSAADLPLASFSAVDFTNANEAKFSCTPVAEHFMDKSGNPIGAGVVVAVYSADANIVVNAFVPLNSNLSPVSVVVETPEILSGMTVYVYAFIKQIPEAVNGVPSNDLPWMYPADTSACQMVGSGVIS